MSAAPVAAELCGRCQREPVAGAAGLGSRFCQRCIDRNARVIELSHTRKAELIELVRRRAEWLAGGPELWSRDELIADILAAEFPDIPGAAGASAPHADNR